MNVVRRSADVLISSETLIAVLSPSEFDLLYRSSQHHLIVSGAAVSQLIEICPQQTRFGCDRCVSEAFQPMGQLGFEHRFPLWKSGGCPKNGRYPRTFVENNSLVELLGLAGHARFVRVHDNRPVSKPR